jgi:hypothetical protein
MFDSTFWTKYIFRIAHIGSMIALSYDIIGEYLNGENLDKNKSFYAVMGVLVALSGTIGLIKVS